MLQASLPDLAASKQRRQHLPRQVPRPGPLTSWLAMAKMVQGKPNCINFFQDSINNTNCIKNFDLLLSLQYVNYYILGSFCLVIQIIVRSGCA